MDFLNERLSCHIINVVVNNRIVFDRKLQNLIIISNNHIVKA